MTVTTPLAPPSTVVDQPVAEGAPRWHRPLVAFAGLTAVLAVVFVLGLLLDDRTVNGFPVWLKPFKFAVSFGLYALALAWLLRLSRRAPRLGWWTGTVIAVVSLAELGAITLQSVRGTASHFNIGTGFDEAVFSFMGMMVVVIWTATLVLAVLVSTQRLADPATMVAIRFGLGLSLIGMMLGFLMVAPTAAQGAILDNGGTLAVRGAHSVGVPDGGPALPLVGWATTGGDLRVPHFIGIHALQLLPVLALVLAWLARRSGTGRLASPLVRVRLMWIVSFGYAGLIGLLTWQALRGQALVRPDLPTIGAAVGLAVAVLAAAAVAVSTASVAHPPASPIRRRNQRLG